MTVINTNIASLKAQAALVSNSRGLSQAMEQLATGKRINSAADDAAGIAIVSKLHGQISSMNQQVRNANDGISLLQTAEAATIQITQMLGRMRELVSQSLSGTYSSADRTNMGTEVTALQTEIDRVASDTSWNGVALLDGTYTGKAVQVSDNSQIDLVTSNLKANTLNVDSTQITFSGTISNSWISTIDSAITTVSNARAMMGSTINRLNYTIDNMTNAVTNLSASASRIEDTDYSIATSNLARHQIIQQSATAMLAQANQQPMLVLSLLK